MTDEQIRREFLDALVQIAPEADPATISATEALRDQLDIDSFDFLRLVVALHERLHVDIPERDYAQLATLDGAISYLGQRLASTQRSPPIRPAE